MSESVSKWVSEWVSEWDVHVYTCIILLLLVQLIEWFLAVVSDWVSTCVLPLLGCEWVRECVSAWVSRTFFPIFFTKKNMFFLCVFCFFMDFFFSCSGFLRFFFILGSWSTLHTCDTHMHTHTHPRILHIFFMYWNPCEKYTSDKIFVSYFLSLF